MATFRIDSNGDNTDGLSWATAYTTWASYIASEGNPVAGEIVLVNTGASPHYENPSGGVTFTGPASGQPAYIIGVDKADDSYNPATAVNFEASGATDDIITDGSLCVFGISFKSGDRLDLNAGDLNEISHYEDCTFDAQVDYMAINSNFHTAINCTFTLGTGGYMWITGIGRIEFINCDFSGSSTYMFKNTAGWAYFRGCDFTGYTGSAFYYSQYGNVAILEGCLLPSSYSIGSVSYGFLKLHGCDTSAGSADNWRYELQGSLGGSWALSTSIYRSGGATFNGSTNYSLGLSANSNDSTWLPIYTDWQNGYIAADSGTQTTWTVYVAVVSTGTLYDDDVWLEVEYLGTSGSPQTTIDVSQRIATPLATHTELTSDGTSSWTGLTEKAYKIAVTGTVNISGMYRWRVGSAYSTSTVYVDPAADVTQA